MSALRTILLILHFIGLAAILGGSLEQSLSTKKVSRVILWGARAQIITGLALAAIVFTGDDADDVNHVKIGVKLLVAIGVVGLAEANAKKAAAGRVVAIIAALTVINIIVATAWH